MPLSLAQDLPPKHRAEGTIVAPLCSTPTSTDKSSQHLQRCQPREPRNLPPEHLHLKYHVQSNFWIIPCPWGQGRALRQRRKQQRWFHKHCVTPNAFGKAQDVQINLDSKRAVCYLKTIINKILFPFWWTIQATENCATDSVNCWFCFELASFRTDQHLCFLLLGNACLKGLSSCSLWKKAAR